MHYHHNAKTNIQQRKIINETANQGSIITRIFQKLFPTSRDFKMPGITTAN